MAWNGQTLTTIAWHLLVSTNRFTCRGKKYRKKNLYGIGSQKLMKERKGKLRKYFQHHRAYRNTSLCSIKDNSKELKWPHGLDGTLNTRLTEAAPHTVLPGRYSYLCNLFLSQTIQNCTNNLENGI